MRFLTTVAVTVLLLPPVPADWQPCGPERLKQAYSVVVSPRNADVIFVLGQGRSIDEPLAYRSTDGGNTWHDLLVGRSQPDVVHAVGSSESLYATIGLELYESRDDGASWVPIGCWSANCLHSDGRNHADA